MIKVSKKIDIEIDALRFLSRISISRNNDCWNWTGGTYKDTRYGYFNQIKTYRAHRVSYAIFKGDLKEDMVIDHICRNRICVNPDHLREVQTEVNVLENSISPSAKNKAKTHCKYGHSLIGSNLIVSKRGKRNCRICQRAHYHIQYRGLPIENLPDFFFYKKIKTHCKNGHEINPTNTKPRSSGIGFHCRLCAVLNHKKRRGKNESL